MDYDAFSLNDPVDEITIPLSKADGEFSPSMTYYGGCERASLTVQFHITSECPSNQYGPQCTKECVGVQRITFYNYIGDTIDLCPYGADCVCEGNFLEPNCILCDENHYPPDLCNVECIPQDNSFGHYTCDPESGDKVCLEGYTDPSTFCVEENEGKGYLLLCYFFLGSYHADAGSGATTGVKLTTTRPVETTTTSKPIKLTATPPVETTTAKPIKLTIIRPIQTKRVDLTLTPPVESTTTKPIKLATTSQATETATSTKPIKLTFIRPIETTTTKNLIQEPTKSVKLTLTRPVETSGNTTKPVDLTTNPLLKPLLLRI